TNSSRTASFTQSTPVSSLTVSKTVSASSTLLTVHIVPGGYATSVTYAGVAMTLASTTGGTETWYLINPTSGTNNVVMNFSTAIKPQGSVVSYTGTDTSNPLGTIAKNNGASGDTYRCKRAARRRPVRVASGRDYGETRCAGGPSCFHKLIPS